jgi:hypothetical protein
MKAIWKKICILGLGVLMVQLGFGQMNPNPPRRGKMMPQAPSPEAPPSLSEVMIFRYLGLQVVQEEYMREVQRISLETKKRGETLRIRLRGYEKRFFELSRKETLNPDEEQEMIKILEFIADVNNELFVLQKNAMLQIEKLSRERERKVVAATQKWLKEVKHNPEEFQRLLNFVRSIPPQDNRMPLPTGDEQNP